MVDIVIDSDTTVAAKLPLCKPQGIVVEVGYCPIILIEEEIEDIGVKHKSEEETVSKEKKSGLKDLSLEKLNQLLEKAIEAEDYEKAASLRDEIGRRN